MKLSEACEKHKLVRRSVLVVVTGLVVASVVVGLINLLELTDPAVRFLLAVIALLNVPMAFYFWQRRDS